MKTGVADALHSGRTLRDWHRFLGALELGQFEKRVAGRLGSR